MRESILTIPINEVFEPKCGCPICAMRDMLENRCIDYIMGAAMMEPDVRIETNKLGFCKEHYDMMLKQKNRLSLALMLSTHLDEISNKVLSKKKLFESSKSKKYKLSDVNSSCFVCSKIEWGMERFMNTLFSIYQKEPDFRKLFKEQQYLCLNHYELLTQLSESKLQKETLNEFSNDCMSLVSKYLDTLRNDVSHYCKMYDYRNTGKDADWGNSKDSIERAIKFLTTR